MKITRIFFALCFCVFATANGLAQDTLRVLCIGNSFSNDAVEQNLVELAAEKGVPLKVGNLYIGGCSLERHARNIRENLPEYSFRIMTLGHKDRFENATLMDALMSDSWDVVTMQQASHFSGQRATYEPFLQELLDSVRLHVRPDTRLLWHMTWAYQQDAKHKAFPVYQSSQQVMYDSIGACTRELLVDYPFFELIPAGTAVQKARATSIGDTMCKDGYHMQLVYGRYCLACVWLEVLTGHSAMGCRYEPEGITPEQKALVQQAAHEAIMEWQSARLY